MLWSETIVQKANGILEGWKIEKNLQNWGPLSEFLADFDKLRQVRRPYRKFHALSIVLGYEGTEFHLSQLRSVVLYCRLDVFFMRYMIWSTFYWAVWFILNSRHCSKILTTLHSKTRCSLFQHCSEGLRVQSCLAVSLRLDIFDAGDSMFCANSEAFNYIRTRSQLGIRLCENLWHPLRNF